MATSSWRTGITVKQGLQLQPQAYNFYQVVRLLEQILSAEKQENGLDSVVRFRGDVGAEYPVETISHIDIGVDGIAKVDVTDYCIAGVKGPLPQAHANWVYRNKRHGKGVLSRFLDLFNQRFLSLRYEIKKRFNLTLFNESPEKNGFYQKLAASTGLTTAGFIKQIPITEESLLRFSGLLVDFRHSLSKARSLFRAILKLPVRFRSFCGEWRDIPAEYHSQLKKQDNCILGQTAVLGTKVWRQDAAMGVILGPLPYAVCFGIQPGKAHFEKIRGILAYLFDRRFNAHLKILLREKDIPASILRRKRSIPPPVNADSQASTQSPLQHDPEGPFPLNLGRNAWLKSHAQAAEDQNKQFKAAKKPERILAINYHMDLLNYGL